MAVDGKSNKYLHREIDKILTQDKREKRNKFFKELIPYIFLIAIAPALYYLDSPQYIGIVHDGIVEDSAQKVAGFKKSQQKRYITVRLENGTKVKLVNEFTEKDSKVQVKEYRTRITRRAKYFLYP